MTEEELLTKYIIDLAIRTGGDYEEKMQCLKSQELRDLCRNTTGFRFYVLSVRWKEFKQAIYNSIFK